MLDGEGVPMKRVGAVVIGAGQAGLSAAYHLQRLGIGFVVLDANERAGGAWQHRWDSLTMRDVHGVAALPDAAAPGAAPCEEPPQPASTMGKFVWVCRLPSALPLP